MPELHLSPSPSSPFRKLVIGRDDITPDEVKQEGDFTVYKLTWFTNGYTKNSKGQRHQLRFDFVFESFELAQDFQVRVWWWCTCIMPWYRFTSNVLQILFYKEPS